jgi:LEA14-like dessication related protein
MKKLLFILISLLTISACNTKKMKPTFQTVKNIKVLEFSKNKVSITAALVFNNPNPVGIKMDKLNLELFVNDTKVSDITQTDKAIISSKSDFEIPIKIEYSPSSMFKNDPQQLINSVAAITLSKKAELKFTGKTQFDVTGIKINVPISYKEVIEIKK